MSLTLYPGAPRVGGTTLAVYVGTPSRRVAWVLTGPGSLTPLTDYTDVAGRACAQLVPVTAGDVITVTVTAGA
jgi:hypothetical protein